METRRTRKLGSPAIGLSFVNRGAEESTIVAAALDGYEGWLRQFSWSHKVDLTFRNEVGHNTAEREFSAFVRRLERTVRRVVHYFGSVESGNLTGRTHIHGVLANTETLTAEAIEELWRAGRSRVAVYDWRRRALRYAAKDLVRADARLLIRLPPDVNSQPKRRGS